MKVLPLQDRVREHVVHRVDERLDELVVRLAPQPPVLPAQVEAIAEQLGVVGADVEADRQRLGRVNPGGGRVQRELPHGDAHAPGPLVAQAQDPLVVGDHDELDVVLGGVAQQVGNAIDVVGRDPDAAGTAQDVAVLLARLADGRRVDDRHELRQVLDQQPVEQGLVAVLQRREADELLQVVALDPQTLQLQLDLLLDGHVPGRHKPPDAHLVALPGRERAVLIASGIAKQPQPADRGPLVIMGCHRLLPCRGCYCFTVAGTPPPARTSGRATPHAWQRSRTGSGQCAVSPPPRS